MRDRIQTEYESVPANVCYSIHNAWGRERKKRVTHRLQCIALIAGGLGVIALVPNHSRYFSAYEGKMLLFLY